MKSAGWAAFLITVFALFCSAPAQANEIEIVFSGVIDTSNTPGVPDGSTFTGTFTYSTDDTFEGMSGGLANYGLTSPGDTLSISLDGVELWATSVTGLTATLAAAPVGFDSNPSQDYFSIGTGSNSDLVNSTLSFAGYSLSEFAIQLVGDLDVPSGGALPNPLNTSGVDLSGDGPLPSSFVFDFVNQNDPYYVVGDINQISEVPEPRGVTWACLGIVAIAGLGLKLSRP